MQDLLVLTENGLLDLGQGRTGLQPEFVAQNPPGPAQRGQRVRLPVAGPQREGEKPPASLAQRLLADQRFSRRNGLGRGPGPERGLGPGFLGGQVLLGQPGYLGRRPLLIGELGVRRAAPERQRLLEVVPGRFGLAGRGLARRGEQDSNRQASTASSGSRRAYPGGALTRIRAGAAVRARVRESAGGWTRTPAATRWPAVAALPARADRSCGRPIPPGRAPSAAGPGPPAAAARPDPPGRPRPPLPAVRGPGSPPSWRHGSDPNRCQAGSSNAVPHAGTTTSTSQGGNS